MAGIVTRSTVKVTDGVNEQRAWGYITGRDHKSDKK